MSFIQQYWLDFIFSVAILILSTATKYLYKQLVKEFTTRNEQLDNVTARQGILTRGLLAILHDRLYTECERLIGRGSVTIDELNNLTHIYNGYHALGGNGTGTALYERCVSTLKIENRKDGKQ